MDKLEKLILQNLIYNEEFTRKVLPYIKQEYFNETYEQVIHSTIVEFISKYNNLPTIEAIKIDINNLAIREDELKNSLEFLDTFKNEPIEQQWLLDHTEKFCQERAVYQALKKSISIIDDEKGKEDKGIIPQILQDALGISFDTNVGHDYIEDADQRFENWHKKEKKIPFDIEKLNDVTNGGVEQKTLNVIMGGVHVGKTLCLCHLAASYLSQGYNVLYITLEMAEEKIAQRIDANLLNIKLDDLIDLPKDLFDKKIKRLRETTVGKLIIKEYPPASASVINFRNLLNELYLKKNYKPQIIIIDYLNLCASCRFKRGTSLYEYIKSVSEELRGLAVEQGLPIWSATQLNRNGFNSSDPGMGDVAESFGLPATADLLWILSTNEELESLGQFMLRQEKNRYKDMHYAVRFIIGVDKPKMRLYDVESCAQLEPETKNEIENKNEHTDFRSKFSKLKV